MVSRLFALLVWALVAGTGVFWGLRLFAQPAQPPTRAVVVSDLTMARGDVSRLLGSAPSAPATEIAAAPAQSTRFRLTGVVAPKHSSEQGLAVISVDGEPPRVYRVGASIDEALMLREVSLRTATVSSRNGPQAGGSFVLELPVAAAAATGVLPPVEPVILPEAVPPPDRAAHRVLGR